MSRVLIDASDMLSPPARNYRQHIWTEDDITAGEAPGLSLPSANRSSTL